MKALLIVDMQKGSFRPYTARYNTIETIQKINRLSACFRLNKFPVIFIQHNGERENCLLPGSDDWELLPELVKEPGDIVSSKTANDAFYQTSLADTLNSLAVGELVICGCATDFCVDATVKSALVLDYKILIASDAHTTADRPFVPALTLIRHYNWLWSDMSPTRFKMEVLATEEICAKLS